MHNYNTRSSSNECFTVKTSRTEKMKKSFTRINVSIWNSIPLSLKSLNKSAYQNKIKNLLLDVLNCEDDYIEVSKLIKHFATLTYPVLYSYFLLVFFFTFQFFSCVSVIYYIVSLFSLTSCIIQSFVITLQLFVCECNLLYCQFIFCN